jgi:hypothetical protein
VVTAELLERRRSLIETSSDLRRLAARLMSKAAPLLERSPIIPEHKALLSRDGGVCADDGAPLTFDPFSPTEHRCPQCRRVFRGERHERHWARFQHLWLAERAAHLAALVALGGEEGALVPALSILRQYGDRYFDFPNADNVLGPSRLFFSTYLESLWVLNYLTAATLLREAGRLDGPTQAAVGHVAEEAANLIGMFDEGFSNRQTWNNAALAAIASWFEDEDLASTAIEGRSGLIPHLRGYREDGLWYEGENYHLFAMRGMVTGATWARLAGVDIFVEPRLRDRMGAALLAPALTALPDLTFPARKDARFGVSLAHPMYLDTWETALGMMDVSDPAADKLRGWLVALYDVDAPLTESFESYLHDAPLEPLPGRTTRRQRDDLSWAALLSMVPELSAARDWTPHSVMMRGQGLAILRSDAAQRYLSLECGPLGGGHGHADRLHLTLHAAGVHWLADFGTRSYLTRDLFWYRSAMAHNVPIIAGAHDDWGEAVCEQFDVRAEWGWARGRVGARSRTIVAGPSYLVDVIETAKNEEHVLLVPWHINAEATVATAGHWRPDDLGVESAAEFIADAARFEPAAQSAPLVIRATAEDAQLSVHLPGDVELWRARGPGAPRGGVHTFYVVRSRGRAQRLVTVLEVHRGAPLVSGVRIARDAIEVDLGGGKSAERHEGMRERWVVRRSGEVIQLAGPVEMSPPFRPLLELEPPTRAHAIAFRQDNAPALDGTTAGFDTSEPLSLDLEDQYRKSEEPYPGPEELAATAHLGWDEDALYLAVEVRKAEPCFRSPDAPPLPLDNEPEDINSDGLQVYVRPGRTEEMAQFLIVPEEAGGAVRVRAAGGWPGDPTMVRGAWRHTAVGYRVTLAIAWPRDYHPNFGDRIGFDLIVNEMRPGRLRRAGQLVWSGGNGWVWLRGDRHSAARLGVVELVG